MRKLEYIVPPEMDGKTTADLLRRQGFSRAIITQLKQGENLLLNGKKARTVDVIGTGDIVTAIMNDETEIVANGDLSVEIVYEDDDIVVFDKPYDMPVHPSIRHYTDTLANYFTALYPDTTFRSVSRLDRNTSGLVVVAKNQLAAARLSGNPKLRPKKLYYAVTHGDVAGKFGCAGEIIAPIAREKESIITRVVRSDGQYAHTVFKVIKSNNDMSYLEISLVTGRTHQIRVHFSHEGFPLLGDDLYGGSRELIGRQALHCGKISFCHPVTNEFIVIEKEPPVDMRRIIDMI